ncbi:MAG: NAD(+)/NADH kinase [Candidatus Njordarchaeia archaeon]
MKLLVIAKKPLGDILTRLTEEIKQLGAECKVSDVYLPNEDFDVVLVIGEDRDVLKVIQEMGSDIRPVLGISIIGKEGFLTEIPIGSHSKCLRLLVDKKFSIERITRLKVKCSKCLLYALNEVAIFPSKSATLMEYALYVDNEFIWRDYSDGLIISTPHGSTAYSMSAGGPIISPKSKVFSIVSVNSLDPARRPLVIPDTSKVVISDINSRYTPEIVVDGIRRQKVTSDIEISKARKNALLIKFDRDSEPKIKERIEKKIEFAKEIQTLPPSAKLILKVLEYEGEMTQKDLVKNTMLPARTVRHALKLLLSKGFIREKPSLLRDARQKIYQIRK